MDTNTKQMDVGSAAFKGERARFLMFEAAQLLLRQQVQSLISLWHLPPELEVCLLPAFHDVTLGMC